ncbi:MAG: putative branched-chain amino acid transport protein, partial [Acidimicrobiales bacterium]|nr:putative branched-chain amino acid transport protein [Acidimicrobiales bacterium]
WGRVLKAIREDEDAVRSLGKNVYWYKMQSLVLGGVFGALGGFVFAIVNQSVQPDNYGTAFTFFCYTALLLGGVARVLGPVIGSMIFWFLLQLTDVALRQAISADYIPESVLVGNEVGQVRLMLVGLGLALLMIFRPQGILGDKREVAVSARR